MYNYEVLYSRLDNGREIVRLIYLGEAKEQKIIVSDYAYAVCFFTSEKSLLEVYNQYFFSERKKNRNFTNAIYLASKGNYQYFEAVDENYTVPYLSSGRIITAEEMIKVYENFPFGKYMTPKKLLETYKVILL